MNSKDKIKNIEVYEDAIIFCTQYSGKLFFSGSYIVFFKLYKLFMNLLPNTKYESFEIPYFLNEKLYKIPFLHIDLLKDNDYKFTMSYDW